MTRTAILHVGMGKTGSTSIQYSLDAADLPLHHYVRTGGSNHSDVFIALFGPDNHRRNLFQIREGRSDAALREQQTEWRRALKAELRDTRKPAVIFSAEALAMPNADAGAVAALRDILAPHFDRFQVIGYVRPPISYLQSSFQQRVKCGEWSRLTLTPLAYRSRFEKFDRLFGRENVTLVKFDRATLAGGDVVLDFTRRIGVALRPDQVISRNETLSLEVMALLFARNCHCPSHMGHPEYSADILRLLDALAGIGTRRLRFSPALVQPHLDAAAEDLDWIEDRLGVPLRDLPETGSDVVGSAEDLLAVAAGQIGAVLALLPQDARAALHTIDDPVIRAARATDLLRTALSDPRIPEPMKATA